jgi:sialate O-acetylesterase
MTHTEIILWLPVLFSDHMTLQRDVDAPVWGRATVGTSITVEIAGQKKSAVADSSGYWMVTLDPMPASTTPGKMTVSGKLESEIIKRQISDILIGDVWLCSGQSNMRWSLKDSVDAEEALALEEQPGIRLFHVETTPGPAGEAEDAGTGWTVCSRETLRDFSAIGYFFGHRIHRESGVPVGLISSSVGGTTIEAWTPRSKGHGYGEGVADQADYSTQVERRALDAKRAVEEMMVDWSAPDLDDASWPNEAHPYAQYGVVWGRKWIDIPEAWAGRDVTLQLSSVQHFDTVFWDGKRVGGTPWKPGSPASNPTYSIPAMTPGRHLLAIRIVVLGEHGGLMMPRSADFTVSINGGSRILGYRDNWKTKLERTLTPNPLSLTLVPGNLFNGMIAPLIPYALRGCIWYQGESNGHAPELYRDQFKSMIRLWRERWGFEFSFLFVQLANWGQPDDQDQGWPLLRESQAMALELPNTGMATAIDVGDAEDIHPRDKKTVGERLAAIALNKPVSHGPRFKSAQRDGDTLRIRFTGIGSGLCTSDGRALQGFNLPAEIVGDEVHVLYEEGSPVRYAWAKNPSANLCNREGFPAEPFRMVD